MKIAISADMHITSYKKNPERYQAFINILDQLVSLNVNTLIIAGDLFDKSCNHPGELEEMLRKSKFEQINIYIIPGNHDPVLSRGAFTLENIEYVTQLRQWEISKEVSLLFVPYQAQSSFSEILALCPFRLKPDEWILVGHGDYFARSHLRNNYEDDSYMPLFGGDIQKYQPRKVFLGHIHAPYDSLKVHYPGSPCGLDISETGVRSFIIYDTEKDDWERKHVDTDVIYLQESLTILPTSDEEEYVRKILTEKMALWNLNEEQKRKARLRINLHGFTADRERLLETIVSFFILNGIAMVKKPDLDDVKLSTDVTRADITMEVQKRIMELGLPTDQDEPTIDEYILSAMSQIYKV